MFPTAVQNCLMLHTLVLPTSIQLVQLVTVFSGLSTRASRRSWYAYISSTLSCTRFPATAILSEGHMPVSRKSIERHKLSSSAELVSLALQCRVKIGLWFAYGDGLRTPSSPGGPGEKMGLLNWNLSRTLYSVKWCTKS